ncbi:hypothetical protein [Rhizobium sp. Leaf341]|uniref:hypothetical protein n=1 Tax=Rhizobium sp. Leaf341 TaxID=1736344 RepID=UPI0007155E48|nr:hypothetical protein [Rhizobium sp. Leaf341]KQR75667.1 hypothetical protein ASG03_18440 [Rhizobium sp. Leaf341]
MPSRSAILLLTGLSLVFTSAAFAQSAPMTVELQSGVSARIVDLKRVPGQDIVQLDYEVINNSNAAVNIAEIGIGRAAYGLNEITLYDFPNKVSFKIGVASECLCTQPPEAPLNPGETFKAWAWFAPPATSPGPFAVRFGSTVPIMDVAVK